MGGRRGEEVLREVWIFDPRTGRWRRGPDMPRPMELLGLAVRGDELHAVWESTYQVYDAATGRWRLGPRPGVTGQGPCAKLEGTAPPMPRIRLSDKEIDIGRLLRR